MSAWLSFFSFLFPSWKFFDRTGTLFRLEASWEGGVGWSPVFDRSHLHFRFSSFFADADRLKHLLAHALAERAAQNLSNGTSLAGPAGTQDPLRLLAELIASLPQTQNPGWVRVRLLACNPHLGERAFSPLLESEPFSLGGAQA